MVKHRFFFFSPITYINKAPAENPQDFPILIKSISPPEVW